MLDSGLQLISRPYLMTSIIFWLTYGFNLSQCCSDIFSNHFGTTTSDMVIKEGDPMEVKCSLLTSSMDLGNGTKVNINSEMLLFKYNGTRIQNSKIQIIDNFTIQYKVKRTSMKENGYYMCYIDVGYPDVKPRAVCVTYIIIAYAPSASDDFNLRCTSYDLKNLTCQWDLQPYNVATDYHLSLIVHDKFNYSMCPTRIYRNTCKFTTRDPSPYLISDKKLRFRLDVINKFGSISKFFDLDHYSNVILDTISSLNFVSIGSQNVYLTWEPPSSIADDPYLEDITEYLLKVYPVQNEKDSIDINYITGQSNDMMNSKAVKMVAIKGSRQYNLSDLIPYTKYRFEVRCRLVTDVGEGEWSKEFVETIQTEPDVPHYYPTLIPGGYEIIRKSEKSLDIIIYYDKVDKIYANGPLFTYILKMDPVYMSLKVTASLLTDTAYLQPLSRPLQPPIPYTFPTNWLKSSNKSSLVAKSFTSTFKNYFDPIPLESLSSETTSNLESSSRPSIRIERPSLHYVKNLTKIELSSCMVENMNTSSDLKVSMFAFNALGFAPDFSSIIIPGAIRNKVHPGVDQLYAINWDGNNYTLYWEVSSKENVKNFTIFWCEVIETPQCDYNINHMGVTGDKSSIELTIDYDKVQFGISVIDSINGLSNGIKWATCIESGSFIRVKNRFRRFNLLSVGSKSILAEWKLDCPALNHLIYHYEIHYCQINHPCSKTLTIIDVNKSTTEYNIINLDSSTVYNFTIHAVTIRGERLEGPTITIETRVDVATLVVGISVIIGGVIIILTVLYTLLIFTMRKRSDEKKLKESVDSNWIPKMPSRLKGDANILLNPLPHEIRNEYENKEYMNSDSNTNINKLNTKGTLNQQIIKDDKNNVIILSTISGNNQLNNNIRCSVSSVSPSTTSSTTTEEPDEGFELTTSINKIGSNRKKLIKSFSSVSSLSSMRKNRSRKYSDGGCDSEDSGYSTKLSDKNVYFKGDTFTIDGLIKSIDENLPYIVVSDSKDSSISIGNINSTLTPNDNQHNVTINRSLSDSDLSCNDQTAINHDFHPSLPNGYLPSQDDYHYNHQNESTDVNTISNGYVYA